VKVVQRNFHSSLPTYWLILFGYWAIEYAGRAARLKASLTEARLDALKTQLNPHFLFNTLNSISSLMYTDTEAADRMMTRLSDLLRSTIQNNGAQEVTLREELAFVERYLEIEKIRFEERLRVRIRVDPEALDGLLPAFALQPLVENAVRHGIGPLESGGSLAIDGRRANGRLVVRITDDGAGAARTPVLEGIGLTNTRARLEELYGGAASLQTGSGNGGGFFAELDVPYRTPGGVRA
jgi:LytS/YehU family sensor histidine kinase